MTSPKIAVVHYMIGYRKSGSGPVVPWILEALQGHCDLSLITTGGVDIDHLNACWGTRISKDKISIIRVPQLFLKYTNGFTALRSALLGRFCQKIAGRFDVMFSAYNVMDFGKKGIQYIGDFLFADPKWQGLYQQASEREKKFVHKDTLFRRLYLGFCAHLHDPSLDMIRKNMTLANSLWTQRMFKSIYGDDSLVVHPPVVAEPSTMAWDERDNGFVCIGKIVPFKQIEQVIEIVKRVRDHGYDVHLHIVGKNEDPAYARKIRALRDRHADWCFLEGGLYAEKKQALIASHKFGINACQNEAFGMAVAEMVKAGAIVWVPGGGGQKEIVDNPALTYDDVDNAVRKIVDVLADAKAQTGLRAHLAAQAARYSPDIYMSEIREAVRAFQEEEKAAYRTRL